MIAATGNTRIRHANESLIHEGAYCLEHHNPPTTTGGLPGNN